LGKKWIRTLDSSYGSFISVSDGSLLTQEEKEHRHKAMVEYQSWLLSIRYYSETSARIWKMGKGVDTRIKGYAFGISDLLEKGPDFYKRFASATQKKDYDAKNFPEIDRVTQVYIELLALIDRELQKTTEDYLK
jgi:hypothetical protein